MSTRLVSSASTFGPSPPGAPSEPEAEAGGAERGASLARRLHQQRLESMGRWMTTAVHDLRTPLASVVFHAHLLRGRGESLNVSERHEHLEQICAAADRLQAALNGLLDFARPGPRATQAVSLREVFERVSSLLRPALREGRHVLLDSLGSGAEWAQGTPLVVEQVLINLVLNGLESAPGPRAVVLRGEAAGDAVRLVVEDDGPGVPESVRGRLFEPFFTTKPEGTGVGLATAREAAREMGGDVVYEAGGPGGGARFTFTLPAGREPKRGQP